MKTRIQVAGGSYGAVTNPLWRGDLPLIPGFAKGLHIVMVEGEESPSIYKVSQTALEIVCDTGEYEQVVYVVGASPVQSLTG
jgi:hypothetical protein